MKLGVFCNRNSSVKWHIVPCKIGGVCAKLFVFDFVKVVLRNFSLTTLGYWKKKKQNKTEKKKRKKIRLYFNFTTKHLPSKTWATPLVLSMVFFCFCSRDKFAY